MAPLFEAVPDYHVTVHEMISEGTAVAIRFTARGTHRGELLGIAPTGRHVEINVIDIVRINEGRYVEHWGVNTLPSVLAALRGG